jgi:nucleoside-triphosphatase
MAKIILLLVGNPSRTCSLFYRANSQASCAKKIDKNLRFHYIRANRRTPEKRTHMKNILIEGRPGIGKTTCMRTLSAKLPQVKIGGFLTTEIRENGWRVGFRIETFAGDAGTLAHVHGSVGPSVGKYRVEQAVLERIGVKGLQQALQDAQILLIDEIGKMELLSCRFQKVVSQCLDSRIPVIATIMLKPHPFANQLKARPDVRLIRITHDNREHIAAQLARDYHTQRRTE